MPDLTLIQTARHGGALGPHSHIRLLASRTTLAKRRWRGVAQDGREFGFDLDEALEHGDHFHAEGDRHYVIEQAEEEVLEIPITSLEQAAQVAWGLGNLHFAVQVCPGTIRAVNDPAVAQFLAREHLDSRNVFCRFQPVSTQAPHHHG